MIFFILFRKSRSEKSLWVIAAYSFAVFVINFGVILTSNTNTILYESLTLIEFLLFSAFIYFHLKSNTAKKILLGLSLAFTVFFFVYIFALPKSITFIDSVPIGVETIIILAFSFFCLYEQTNDTSTLFIYNKYIFWIILGIVLYLAGSFFIYIFTNFLTPKEVRKYWPITNVFSILKNIFFCIAIYLHSKPPKETTKYNLELSSLN